MPAPPVLVCEIHPVNLVLWALVSLVRRVRVFRVHRACRWLLTANIELIDLERYLSAETVHCFRAEALARWGAVMARVRAQPWFVDYDGYRLDLTAKACQDLAKHLERWMLLERIVRQEGGHHTLIDSWASAYLRRLQAGGSSRQSTPAAFLSSANRLCDAAWQWLLIGKRVTETVGAILRGLAAPRSARKAIGPLRYVWDAVSPNELHLARDQRHFFWVVDGQQVTADEVLFLLPPNTGRRVLDALRRMPYRCVRGLHDLYPTMARRILWRCLWDVVRSVPRLVTQGVADPEGLTKAGYVSRLLIWTAVIRQFRPRCYITSVSVMADEHPAVAYLNAVGCSTVMYSYSANASQFGSEGCRCDFRGVEYAHILAKQVVVWNKPYADFLAEHPQDGARIHAMGPLMAYDDHVAREGRIEGLAPFANGSIHRLKGLKRIAVFDEAAITAERQFERRSYPDYYTERYWAGFLRDIVRLLEEMETVLVLYKPQRSLLNPRVGFHGHIRELIEQIQRHPRGMVLSDHINIWLPIGLADLCIGMPFTSPVQAGWHYGIPGLYHDPTNQCRAHRYHAVDAFITHRYLELRAKAQALLQVPAHASERKLPAGTAFVGSQWGDYASDRFRSLLQENSTPREVRDRLRNEERVLMGASYA